MSVPLAVGDASRAGPADADGPADAAAHRRRARLRSVGGLTPDTGAALARRARRALAERAPLVVRWQASGTELDDGLDALTSWGRAARAVTACSGVVPVVVAVEGPVTGPAAFLLGVADLVVMTRDAHAFVSGPSSVRSFTGEVVTAGDLGGSLVHERRSGVAAVVVDDPADLDDAVAEILDHLPPHTDDLPPRRPTGDRPDRATPELAAVLPAATTGSYDVREVLRTLADDGAVLELRGGFAPNLVTALGHVDGAPVGFVANQPCALAGTIDIPAAQKGARFVAFCDAFNLPLVTVVDTPGFYPGRDQEWRGMIRHGAQLAFAYARATVPRVSITLRKSYGGAYIVMDAKTMGNDIALAWPTAEIAVMGARGAVEILHRGAEAAARAGLEADYEAALLNPWIAAGRGLIDAVVDPADTRRELAAALDVLATKREQLVRRAHDNTPL